MAFFFWQRPHPSISLDDLKGFEEDPEACRIFERRFSSGVIWGILLFLGGIACIFGAVAFFASTQGNIRLTLLLMLLGLLIAGSGLATLLVPTLRMHRAIPVSPRSGQAMEVYRLEDTIDEGKHELAYVCRKSHTFFRRVYVERGIQIED